MATNSNRAGPGWSRPSPRHPFGFAGSSLAFSLGSHSTDSFSLKEVLSGAAASA